MEEPNIIIRDTMELKPEEKKKTKNYRVHVRCFLKTTNGSHLRIDCYANMEADNHIDAELTVKKHFESHLRASLESGYIVERIYTR
jgi:hypothetical protein